MEKVDLTLFREKFIEEARDRISRMNNLLVHLEKDPGDSRVESDLLREAHTLKGAAKMMGVAPVAELSHGFEEALSRKKKKAAFSRDLNDALFLALDFLSRSVESLALGGGDAIDIGEAIGRLRTAQAPAEGSLPSPDRTPAPRTEIEEARFSDPWGDAGRSIRVEPEKLESLANLVSRSAGHLLRQGDTGGKIGSLSREYEKFAAELLAVIEPAIAHDAVSPEFAAGIAPIIEKGKQTFREIGTRMGEFRRQEEKESTGLLQVLEDLRSEILAIHMIPLTPLFESFQRMVRDLSKQLGKEVDLVVQGGNTGIDRKAAEALADPLIHLMRNAIDHGIEVPQVRLEKNKPARGVITVSATPKKGRAVIEIEDDGKGIDLQEIRETAVRKGLTTEKAAYRLDEREVLSFLFQQGFTTSSEVTDMSGRGMGMDVVRATVEKFNGTVALSTVPGKSTKVTIELPFSMALSRVLIFRAGDQHFGIPIIHSAGVIRFSNRDVVPVEGKRSLRFEGTPVPIVAFSRLVGLPPRTPPHGDSLAILVRHSQRHIALEIDGVEGEQEVVVKDLGSYLGKIPLFMGSTVLRTGEIALLLDVYDLVSAVHLRPESSAPQAAPEGGASGRILVVDDSLLSREMKQRILSSMGYHVETARGDRAELDPLSGKRFDLIVAGAGKEGMSGTELLGRIREVPHLRLLPVVLVVPREHLADRERYLAAGSRECIGREEFSMASLAPILDRLLGKKANG